MKKIWEIVKEDFWYLLIAFVIGAGISKLYTYDTIIKDCKVLGAFRINNTAFGCQIGYNIEDKK